MNIAIWTTPRAPQIMLGDMNTDPVTGERFVQLGYPDIPSSPSPVTYLAGRGLSVRSAPKKLGGTWDNYAVGERIQFNFKGKAQNGFPISWSSSLIAKDDSTGALNQVNVPADIVKALAGQIATLEYVVTPAASDKYGKVRTSGPLTFRVRGLYLPAPELLEAINGSIDPDHISAKAAVNFVTVSLDYPGMQLGDTVRLVREGVDGKQSAINFVDKDRPISATNLQRRPMKITWTDADIKPLLNGVMNIHYKVYKNGIWYTSPRRTIYVGPSLASLPPFINEVVSGRLDPDLIADSVNVHIPSAGTVVKDTVTLFWSDASKQKTFTDQGVVTQQNVDGDMSFDVYLDNPIEFNRGKIVTVFYLLERVLPDGRKVSFRSADYQFFVGSQAAQEAADSRVLKGAVVDGVKDGQMDAALQSAGTKLTVPFAETQEGDSVTAYWQSAEGGDPVVLGTQSVDAKNVNLDLIFNISAATVKAALSKNASVYYVIERKGLGGKIQKFRSQEESFSVGPRVAGLLLPAPEVSASVEWVLDPMSAQDGTKVVIRPYPTIAVGDTVRLFWIGTDGPGTPIIKEQTVSSVGAALVFIIPASAIGADTGTEVWVYYQVTRKGMASPIDSEDTVIYIEMLGQDDLAVPVIKQAPGDMLDLGSVKTDIVVTLKKWPFMAAGQRVWLRLEGTAKDASPVEINVWTARLLTDADAKQDISITIARAEFDRLGAGSSFLVYAKVTLDGDFTDAFAEDFPTLNVVIKSDSISLSVTPSFVDLTAEYPKSGSAEVPPAGSSQQLIVSGGKPSYKFNSEQPSIVEVSDTGLLKARKNGKVTITVTDAAGMVVWVTVTVQGIVTLEYLNFHTYTECEKIAKERNLEIPTLAKWKELVTLSDGKLNVDFPADPSGGQWEKRVWTSTAGTLPFTKAGYFPDTGATKNLKDAVVGGETAYGFVLPK
ncbi:Ig-like domain-containing protein [Pseudomonas coronafaciens]|uniref:Ig-like domain-containing protein n=1 Tax=Pseudomonas coronafaciens TaxID=53409 RepID=UPI0009BFCA40